VLAVGIDAGGVRVEFGPFTRLRFVDELIYADNVPLAEFRFHQKAWFFYRVRDVVRQVSLQSALSDT